MEKKVLHLRASDIGDLKINGKGNFFNFSYFYFTRSILLPIHPTYTVGSSVNFREIRRFANLRKNKVFAKIRCYTVVNCPFDPTPVSIALKQFQRVRGLPGKRKHPPTAT